MRKTKESVRFHSNSGTFELDVLEASQRNHVRNYPFSPFNMYEGGRRKSTAKPKPRETESNSRQKRVKLISKTFFKDSYGL